MAKARLLIVDDDADMRATLTQWCRQEGFEVESAASASEALSTLGKRTFDLVLLDLVMPGVSGNQLLGLVKDLDPAVEVVIFTGHPSLETARETLRAGKAFDYLPKIGTGLAELSSTLNAALNRRRESLDARAGDAHHSHPRKLSGLTLAERDVADLLLEGMTTRRIADRLGLTQGTVRNRLSTVYQKLGVSDRVAAIAALHSH